MIRQISFSGNSGISMRNFGILEFRDPSVAYSNVHSNDSSCHLALSYSCMAPCSILCLSSKSSDFHDLCVGLVVKPL